MKLIYAVMFSILTLCACVVPQQAMAETTETKVALITMIMVETRQMITRIDANRIVNASFNEAKKHGIDPFLIISLINQESKFRSAAKNKSGASGLMQVIPRWHRDKIKGRNIMAIETNVEVGTQVLADCLKKHNDRMNKALACYSGGAKNYKAKLKAGHTMARMADLRYRFENELPIIISSQFDKPRDFAVLINTTNDVAHAAIDLRYQAEPQLLASSVH